MATVVKVQVRRQPADKQAEDIVDSLCTSVEAARARGVSFIDYSYSNRKRVSGTSPLKNWIPPTSIGTLSMELKSNIFMVVTGIEIDIVCSGSSFTATTVIDGEILV